jgi:small subunit ribosomal protein S9
VIDAEHPEDQEPQDLDGQAPADDAPQPAAADPEPVAEPDPEPVAAEPDPEPVAAEPEPEPVAAEPEPEPEPVAAEPDPEPVALEEPESVAAEPEPAETEPLAAEEEPAAAPAAQEVPEPAAQEVPEPAAQEVPEPAAQEPAPTVEEPAAAVAAEEPIEEIELQPRVKPEIPGADLIPDIVPEGAEALHLDAEAQAAAEAEAEEASRADSDREEDAQPIADAAIDLAAGARYRATGKRKTAVARVILKPGTGVYMVNGKTLEVFFPRPTLERVIRQPLETVGYEARMDVIAKLHGGGVSAQAGALRHGISRALIDADPNLRGELKRRGFLTRDPRVKERKKAGLKKARKRPQFSKR